MAEKETKMSKKKRNTYLVIGAVLVVVYYLYKKGQGGAANTSTVTGASTALSPASLMQSPVYVGQPAYSTSDTTGASSATQSSGTDQQLAAVVTALGDMESQINAAIAASQGQTTANQPAGGMAGGVKVQNFTLPKGTSSTAVTALASLEHTNVVRKPDGSVVVATGGDSYNRAVNAAGGQWIDHQWFAGSYQNGSFVTASKSKQSAYNNLTKKPA